MSEIQTTIAAVRHCVEISPADVPLRLHLAGLLMRAKYVSEALHHLVRVLSRDRTNMTALYLASRAAAAGGTPRLAPGESASGAYAAAPRLGELRNSLLYGDVWERPQLSKRDRSMITVAALQALYRDQVRGHIGRALDNGVTQEEISEIILHLTFYAGWPAAVKAGGLAARVFEERGLPLGRGGE